MKIDLKILKFLYSKKHDNIYYDVSKHLKARLENVELSEYVLALEENEYITKEYPGRMSESMIPPGDDLSPANNCICKITSKGINYFENNRKMRHNTTLSIIAIAISFTALLFSVLTNKIN